MALRNAVVVAFVALAAVSIPLHAQDSAWIIDGSVPAVVRVDLATASASSTPVPITPSHLTASPDGKTVLIAMRSPGSVDLRSPQLWRPIAAKASASVIVDGKATPAVELGWGQPLWSGFSPDRKSVFVLSSGYETNSANDSKNAEITQLDATTGSVVKRLDLDRGAVDFKVNAAGTTGALLSDSGSLRSKRPVQITFIDLTSLQKAGTIDVGPGTVATPVLTGDRLYFGAGGSLHISTLADKKIQSRELGGNVVVLGPDDQQQLFVLSGARKKPGHVSIFKDGVAVKEIDTVNEPLTIRMLEDHRRFVVVGSDQLALVDTESGKSTALGDNPGHAISTVVSADGRRAYVASLDGVQCCRVTSFDIPNAKQLTSFLGGSKAARIGQGLLAASLGIASLATSGSTGFYTIYTPRARAAGLSPLVFGPGDKKVYLADAQTSNVTVIDAETGQRIKNIGAGPDLASLYVAPASGIVGALNRNGLALIDATNDQIESTIKVPSQLRFTPDHKRFLTLSDGTIVIYDASTLKETGRITSVAKPVDVMF